MLFLLCEKADQHICTITGADVACINIRLDCHSWHWTSFWAVCKIDSKLVCGLFTLLYHFYLTSFDIYHSFRRRTHMVDHDRMFNVYFIPKFKSLVAVISTYISIVFIWLNQYSTRFYQFLYLKESTWLFCIVSYDTQSVLLCIDSIAVSPFTSLRRAGLSSFAVKQLCNFVPTRDVTVWQELQCSTVLCSTQGCCDSVLTIE